MPGAPDSNGIYQYASSDLAYPFHQALNKLASSVSGAFTALRDVVGSTLVGSGTATSTGALGTDIIYTPASITLTPGTWQLQAAATITSTDVTDSVSCSIHNTTTSAEVANARGLTALATVGGAPQNCLSRPVVVTVAVSTTFSPRAVRNGASTPRVITASATLGPAAYITATRLA